MNLRSLLVRIASKKPADYWWYLIGKWTDRYNCRVRGYRERNKKYPVVNITSDNHSHHKKALMCYLLDPFLNDYDHSKHVTHSNHWRSIKIVSCLERLGYSVDVTDWRNAYAPKAKYYDLIIGLGVAYYSSLDSKSIPQCKKIYLGTGAHFEQAVRSEVKRIKQLETRRNVECKPRLSSLRRDIGPEISDAIFVIGDEWACQTYRDVTDVPVFSCPNNVVDGVRSTVTGKDFASARRNFLWMSGYGAVHRGLDLLLEIFANSPELHLWICGGIAYETDFMASYNKELTEFSNIHYVGWVDVTGDTFSEITHKCGYIIYPSASDGMPGSVINSMAAGLVPILTKEAGVDTGGMGVKIEQLSMNVLKEIIFEAATHHPERLMELAIQTQAYTKERYSKDAFESAFMWNMAWVVGD